MSREEWRGEEQIGRGGAERAERSREELRGAEMSGDEQRGAERSVA